MVRTAESVAIATAARVIRNRMPRTERAGGLAGPLASRRLRRLRGQLPDPRRPVGEGSAGARPVACASARPQQVVAGAAHEERAAPRRVVAVCGGDVLAGDPDRVTVDGGRAVVAPARPDRVREP